MKLRNLFIVLVVLLVGLGAYSVLASEVLSVNFTFSAMPSGEPMGLKVSFGYMEDGWGRFLSADLWGGSLEGSNGIMINRADNPRTFNSLDIIVRSSDPFDFFGVMTLERIDEGIIFGRF